MPTVPKMDYDKHDSHSKRIFDANNWRDFDISDEDIKDLGVHILQILVIWTIKLVK